MPADRLVNLELVGREDLRRMLAEMPKRTRDKIIARAFRTWLRLVRDSARAKAPILQDESTLGSTSQGRIPGTLRKNIKTAKKFRGPGRLGVGVYIAARDSFGIADSSPWFYPAHVHYGHSVVNAAGDRLTPRDLAAIGGANIHGKTNRNLLGNRQARKARERLLATGQAKRSVEPRPFMADAWTENKAAIESGVISDLETQIPIEARELMGGSASQ